MQEYKTITSVNIDLMGCVTAKSGEYRLPSTAIQCRSKDGKPIRPVPTVKVGQLIIMDRNISNHIDEFPDALKQGQQFDCILFVNNKRYPCIIAAHADGGYLLSELEAKKDLGDGDCYVWVKCSELLNTD